MKTAIRRGADSAGSFVIQSHLLGQFGHPLQCLLRLYLPIPLVFDQVGHRDPAVRPDVVKRYLAIIQEPHQVGARNKKFNPRIYGELLLDVLPRLIETEAENERALAVVDRLMSKDEDNLAPEETTFLLSGS